MKKRLLLIGIALIVGVAIFGCGSEKKTNTESSLKKTYKNIEKEKSIHRTIRAAYDKERDHLEIAFYPGAKIDKLFNILNKNIKGTSTGSLYFETLYDVTDEEKEKICERVGKLNPKSVKVFGMDSGLMECKNHTWTNILPKTDVLYAPSAAYLYDCNDANSKKNLETVRKVWLYNGTYGGIGLLPNLEEVGIYATFECTDDRASTQGKVYGPDGSSSSYPTVAHSEIVTDKKGKVVKEKPIQKPFEFNENFDEPNDFYGLANAKKLKKITIAPCFDEYTIQLNSDGYFFAIANVRNDLLINKPETTLSNNSYINIDEFNKTNNQLTKSDKEFIVHQFLADEVKDVYKKAKKFKQKNKKGKITDKALVYLAQPGESNFAKKKVYHSEGRVLDSSDLGNKFKLPEKANDYKYFVYVYPTFKYYGKYDRGTKAYTKTYWAQVFDLDKKIAYKPQKIGSKKPEQTIRVSGIPDKYAPTFGIKKIYKFIKNLAK